MQMIKEDIRKRQQKKYIIENITKIIKLCYHVSPRNVIEILLLNIFGGILPIILMIIWQFFLDAITAVQLFDNNKKLFYQIFVVMSIYTLLIFLQNVINRCMQFLTENESEQIELIITDMVLNQIQKLSVEEFEKTDIYNSIKKVLDNTTKSTLQVLQNLIQLIRNWIILAGTCFLFVQLHYGPIVICLIGSIPSFVLSLKVMEKWHKIYCERCEGLRYIDCLKNIIINSENIKEVKFYQLDNYFKKFITDEYVRFNAENKKVRKKFLGLCSIANLFELFWGFIAKIYTIVKCMELNKSVGEITLFINGVQQFSSSLQTVLEILEGLYDSNLYIDELLNFLNLEIKLKESDQHITFEKFKSLELCNVNFKYPNMNRYILKDINLKIEQNKHYAIVGENGSGKSTLLNLIAGFYLNYEGDVFLNSENMKSYNKNTYYSKAGMVFQNYLKLPLSIKDNIEVGCWWSNVSLEELHRASGFSGADKFIDLMPNKFLTMLHKEWEGGEELSIGQWQKVILSRAIYGNKEILFMDEPTASFDERSEKNVFERIKNIKKTCVYIVHNQELALSADEIILIENGTVRVMKPDEWKRRQAT